VFFKDGLSAALSPFRSFPFRSSRAAIASLLAITLCGCSFDLGPWSAQEKEATPQPAPAATSVSDAQSATSRGEALMRSGKTKEALAEFDKAIALDPHNAQALYNGGLLYQTSNISSRSPTSHRRTG
jgi:Tfp pilus assembly protein PilF